MPCHTQPLYTQRQFEAAGLGPGSYDDAVLSAHEALGLVTEVGPQNDRHATPALHNAQNSYGRDVVCHRHLSKDNVHWL